MYVYNQCKKFWNEFWSFRTLDTILFRPIFFIFYSFVNLVIFYLNLINICSKF